MAYSPVAPFLALLAASMSLPAALHAQSAFTNWGGVTDPVAVASTSSAEYARQKFAPGTPKPESYLFFQGKFDGGTTRDPDLEKAQFDQIAKIVAENMVHQNYFPSKDPKNADLLIVVHWGQTTTDVEPNYAEDKNALGKLTRQYIKATQHGMSPEAYGILQQVNAQQAVVDADEQVIMKQVAVNAQLLGFKDQFYKDQSAGNASASTGTSTDENSMLMSLQEERYYVILMAYDYHTMKKGSTPKLLWSTRFSIRAPGNTFTATLPVMAKAASDYFGHAVDGLKIVKPPPVVPEGKVEMSSPTVVPDSKAK
jgi:hypothetical protein